MARKAVARRKTETRCAELTPRRSLPRRGRCAVGRLRDAAMEACVTMVARRRSIFAPIRLRRDGRSSERVFPVRRSGRRRGDPRVLASPGRACSERARRSGRSRGSPGREVEPKVRWQVRRGEGRRDRRGRKANNLAYIGDGIVGEARHIGAGTDFLQLRRKQKHQTKVGKGAFIGRHSSLVAPVT